MRADTTQRVSSRPQQDETAAPLAGAAAQSWRSVPWRVPQFPKDFLHRHSGEERGPFLLPFIVLLTPT